MKQFTPEMIAEAKKVNSAEELLAFAKEHEMELTAEQAAAYFAQIGQKDSGELADEELDNVAGGWCYHDGRPVVTLFEMHDCFVSDYCISVPCTCNNCKYLIYEDALWLCDNPKNKK